MIFDLGFRKPTHINSLSDEGKGLRPRSAFLEKALPTGRSAHNGNSLMSRSVMALFEPRIDRRRALPPLVKTSMRSEAVSLWPRYDLSLSSG